MLRLLNQLFDQLENHGGDWRRFRDAREPDRLCLYWDVIAQNGNWHVLTFRIDDATAQDYLIGRSVERKIRPCSAGNDSPNVCNTSRIRASRLNTVLSEWLMNWAISAAGFPASFVSSTRHSFPELTGGDDSPP